MEGEIDLRPLRERTILLLHEIIIIGHYARCVGIILIIIELTASQGRSRRRAWRDRAAHREKKNPNSIP